MEWEVSGCLGHTVRLLLRFYHTGGPLDPFSGSLQWQFPSHISKGSPAEPPLSAHSELMGIVSVVSTGVRQGFLIPGLLLLSHSDNPDPTKGTGHGTAVLPAE